MESSAEHCARRLLETTPLVMQFIHCNLRVRRVGGLSLVQFRALGFLARARCASLSAVAEHLGLSLPALSRLIDGLVRKKLVKRQTGLTDRRQVALTLTARGRMQLEAGRAEVRRLLAAKLAVLTADERAALERALESLRRVFEPCRGVLQAKRKALQGRREG